MRIRTIIAFIDMQAKVPEDAEVPAGKEITVTAQRAAELIALGIAEAVDGQAAGPANTANPNN